MVDSVHSSLSMGHIQIGWIDRTSPEPTPYVVLIGGNKTLIMQPTSEPRPGEYDYSDPISGNSPT